MAGGFDFPPLARKQKQERASIAAFVTLCRARGLNRHSEHIARSSLQGS
jgi:hypothetical protein